MTLRLRQRGRIIYFKQNSTIEGCKLWKEAIKYGYILNDSEYNEYSKCK